MGKGNRVRTERSDERKAKKEAAAKRVKREARNRVIATVVSVVLIVAIVCTLAYTAFLKDMIGSNKLHGATAASTENYSVSAAQMTYFYNLTYQSYLSQYGQYATYLGLDSTKNLADQAYTMGGKDEGYTWHNYFADSSKDSVQEVLVLCEEAKKRDLALDDEDKKAIDDAIESLKNSAKSAKMSLKEYLKTNYGSYVTEEDVRGVMEMQQLAGKAYTAVYDQPTYTDDQLKDECEKNLASYYFCDYKSIQIAPEDTDDDDETAAAKAKEDAKAAADKILAASTDEAGFDAAVEEYYRAENKIVADDAEDKDAEGNMTETKLKETLEKTLTTGSKYTVDTDFGKWAFEKGEDGAYLRKAGDATLITDEKTGNCTVYFMIKPMYRHDYTTKNVRHILITKDSYDKESGLPDADAKKQAEQLLADFKAGDATEDAFAKLAGEKTMDTGSKSTGGLYENVTEGAMVENFDAWIYDSERKAGDTDIVSTDYGYHVMYFVGEGKFAWQVEAEKTLRGNDYQTAYSDIKTAYPVTYDDKSIDNIKQIGL